MIELPAEKTSWPLPGHDERYQRMRLNSAWYAGDPAKLRAAHGAGTTITMGTDTGTTINPTPGLARRVIASIQAAFWGGNPGGEVDTRRHLPTPQDISTVSSELLFSEGLQIKVVGPVQPADGPLDGDGEPTYRKGDPMPETAAAQARLDFILKRINFRSLLLASAEIASALGSTGLRLAYDKSGPVQHPVITRQDADSVFPIYSWGQLVGVIFWQQVIVDRDDVVWRHLELHAFGTGKVFHGLYKGSSDNLGTRMPLTESEATKGLAKLVDAQGGIQILRSGGKTATSIPNILPDPLDRPSNAGRSDYTPAVQDLFDAIDKTYSQMMDSIDDARSRLFIADSMLEKKGAGKGVGFDPNQRLFNRVKVPPAEKENGTLPIEKVQFAMNIVEYLTGIDALIAKAIRAAGFNAQTMGDESGGQMTATEFRGREGRSASTRDKKIAYWESELPDLLTSLVQLDVEQFAPRVLDGPLKGQLIAAYPVEITFPDAVQPTMIELAETAKALKDAAAASTYVLVKTVHPDWTEPQINAEVSKIQNQASVIDPVSFGVGGAGVGPGDGI